MCRARRATAAAAVIRADRSTHKQAHTNRHARTHAPRDDKVTDSIAWGLQYWGAGILEKLKRDS